MYALYSFRRRSSRFPFTTMLKQAPEDAVLLCLPALPVRQGWHGRPASSGSRPERGAGNFSWATILARLSPLANAGRMPRFPIP